MRDWILNWATLFFSPPLFFHFTIFFVSSFHGKNIGFHLVEIELAVLLSPALQPILFPLSVIFEERYQIEDFANLKIYWPLPFWFLNFMPNNFCVKILKIELKFMLKIILFIFENCTESHAENKSVLIVLIFKILGWGILNICLKNWN